MKEREATSALDLVYLLVALIILLFFAGCGLSIYESIKVNNELKHRGQIKKVEIHKTKHIKRLYKDAFKERK